MDLEDLDQAMRMAAFDAVRRLMALNGEIRANDLKGGFQFDGKRYPLINPQRGIFKPREMRHLLSIRTVFPRVGAKVWYDDQRQIHQQVFEADSVVDYAFMGTNPESADNRWLRDAYERRIPLIYFLGIAPGIYEGIMPVHIVGWDPAGLKVKVAFSDTQFEDLPLAQAELARRYALKDVKQRLHQASFREAVIHAYGGRCALSGLPEPRLLDAAHIIADGDLQYGQPVVRNGIPLSKIHHAAFDAHMIGIDPDYRIHVADHLRNLKDGPFLDALQQLHQRKIHLPVRPKDHPDRDRLARRFEIFRAAR